VDQGNIAGEDIAPHTFTFFPAVAQASDGTLAFGFSASGSGVYPGSYHTHRKPSDPAGTVRPSQLVRRGTGRYQRVDNLGRNRWGDYSGIGVDPDQCFWVYNEHSANPSPTGNGTWATAWAQFCPGLAECGNGTIEPGESCDGEPQCRPGCTFCGDGELNPSETCDPPGGSCRADCTGCGDSILHPLAGEECDDGDAQQGDGCDENCIVEECGNGVVQIGETCDPPGFPDGAPNECRTTCTFCGDTITQSVEQCDDGNNIDGDGCSGVCKSGCGTVKNFFTQTILATDHNTLAWPSPVNIDWVEGNLSAVSTYSVDASGSAPLATSLTWLTNPGAGQGRYKMVRVDCSQTSWSSGGVGECTGDPPGPAQIASCRDIALP
jgi:cysteine-rich repeat protein